MVVEAKHEIGGVPPRRTTAVVALVAFALGVGVTLALRKPPTTTPPAPAARGEPGARRVRMPATLREQAGVETVTVQTRPLTPAIELVGSVEFDGDHVAEVGSRIHGRVARVLVPLGATVRAGDPLAEIESAAVGEVVAAYLVARAHATAARAESERLAVLARQQLATGREIEQTRAQLAAQEAEMQSASQRLLAMGLAPDEMAQITRGPRSFRVTLRAPIAGKVVARPTVLGQVVEPTTPLLRLADPTRLWVQLELFERDLARVRVGDAVEITTETYPGRVFRGEVSHLAATVSPETRTVRVRIAVLNDDEALRPGQFVTARVRTGSAGSRPVLTVPRSSVVQLEGRPAAFVAAGEDTFEVRTLELGAADGEEVEVVRGIAAGEAVVIRGAFSLKSELLR